MADLSDHTALLAALGGVPKVAQLLGQKPVTVRAWRARNRIPPEFWEELRIHAQDSGIEISADWLLSTMPKRATSQVAA